MATVGGSDCGGLSVDGNSSEGKRVVERMVRAHAKAVDFNDKTYCGSSRDVTWHLYLGEKDFGC